MSDEMKLDDHDRIVLRDIAEHGWHAVQINDERPSPFVFSVGIPHTLGHPELVMFGPDQKLMHGLMWDVYREIAGGRRFDADGLFDGILDRCAIAVRRVEPSWHPFYLGYAQWHRRYLGKRGTLEAVQLVWPDMQGRFPWEDGCDAAALELQPRLDQPMPDGFDEDDDE